MHENNYVDAGKNFVFPHGKGKKRDVNRKRGFPKHRCDEMDELVWISDL